MFGLYLTRAQQVKRNGHWTLDIRHTYEQLTCNQILHMVYIEETEINKTTIERN